MITMEKSTVLYFSKLFLVDGEYCNWIVNINLTFVFIALSTILILS